MDLVQKAGYDAIKSYAGVKVAKQLNLAGKVNLGDSMPMRTLTDGLVYATISDVINYFTQGNSKLMRGDILGFGDDAVYLGLFSLGSQVLGTDDMLMNTINNVSPFRDRETNEELAEAVFLTTGRFMGDYLDGYNAMPQFKIVRHPVNYLLKK